MDKNGFGKFIAHGHGSSTIEETLPLNFAAFLGDIYALADPAAGFREGATWRGFPT